MIEFAHREVPAGGVLAGRVSWRPGEPAPAGTIAWLVWRLEVLAPSLTRTGVTGFEDYRVVDRLRLDPRDGGGAFEFRIPDPGPVTYDGKLFRVIWEVVVGTLASSSGPQPVACASFRVVANAGAAAP